MPEQPKKPLIRHTKDTYGESFNADLVEQYKVFVQSAENVSARRVSSGRYLVTANAALVALYGFQSAGSGPIYLMIPVAIVGIIVSTLSYIIIKSHRDLNRVKFEVIRELEQHLPAGPYDYEWPKLGEGRSRAYRPISLIELGIPIVFGVLHGIAFLLVIFFLICGMPGWAQ